VLCSNCSLSIFIGDQEHVLAHVDDGGHVLEVVGHVEVVNVVLYLAHDFISRCAHIQMRQSTLLEEQDLDRKIVSRTSMERNRQGRMLKTSHTFFTLQLHRYHRKTCNW
jgi:hypothetical protein